MGSDIHVRRVIAQEVGQVDILAQCKRNVKDHAEVESACLLGGTAHPTPEFAGTNSLIVAATRMEQVCLLLPDQTLLAFVVMAVKAPSWLAIWVPVRSRTPTGAPVKRRVFMWWAMVFFAKAALDDVFIAHIPAAMVAVVQVHLAAEGAT